MSHILIVSHRSLPAIGGVERIIDQEVKANHRAGHTVTWLSSDCMSKGEAPRYPEGVEVIKVPSLKFLDEKLGIPYPLFSPIVLARLWREIRRCDRVHVHGSLFVASLPALLIAWWHGRPTVLTEHVVFDSPRLQLTWILEWIGMETVGRLCALLSDRIIVYNDRVAAYMRRLARSNDTVVFVPYVIDTGLFRPPTPEQRRAARAALGWRDGRPKALFVGRLIADKGVRVLLDARDPGYDLVFCGPGTESMRAEIRSRGAACLPPRRHEEMPALYHAADLVVLPSCREGFPLVAREALAAGLQVLLADSAGYGSYRHLPGLSFCRRNAGDLREAIRVALGREWDPCRRDVSVVNEHTPQRWLELLYGPQPGEGVPGSPVPIGP